MVNKLIDNTRFKRVLFLSNGHGEDVCNREIIKAFTQACSNVEVVAMPIVGEGEAYRSLGIPIIGPTQQMPSGGVFYMNPLVLWQDIWSGLINLTWRQLKAVWQYSRNCDLIFATGDIVVVAIAYLTQSPYLVFLSGNSSYYEGRLNLGLILPQLLKSKRCLKFFTRDAFTAEDLRHQGLTKATYVGTPVMDMLEATGKELQLIPDVPLISLLPGSRLPEATNNFSLLLELVIKIARVMYPQTVQFKAALIPQLMTQLKGRSISQAWQYSADKLSFQGANLTIEVACHSDAFADLLHQSNLVIGMTGTAIEQAVGLGKPVITIPGEGPSFTYRFAEAQTRLLGCSVQLIGTKPATSNCVEQAAYKVKQTLQDSTYFQNCIKNGRQRMGIAGASVQIAESIKNYLELPNLLC